jgi:hypothetical protein
MRQLKDAIVGLQNYVAAVVAVASSFELVVESVWSLFLVAATVDLQNAVAAAVSAVSSLSLFLCQQ